MSEHISDGDPELLCLASVDLQNVGQAPTTQDGRLIERLRAVVDMFYDALRVDKNHIEFNKCIAHPERQALGSLVHEQHARECAHFGPVHQSPRTFLDVIRDFDGKARLPPVTFHED
jgi:hypothetical protein